MVKVLFKTDPDELKIPNMCLAWPFHLYIRTKRLRLVISWSGKYIQFGRVSKWKWRGNWEVID